MKRSVHTQSFQKHLMVVALGMLSISMQAQTASKPVLTTEAHQQRLSWTADPALDDQFVVQRKDAGTGFTDIALVWTGTGFYSYQFTDKKPSQGNCTYRLKRVATNRIISYTTVENDQALHSFPNPAHDHLVLTAPEQWTSKQVRITILKSDGTLAMQSEVTGATSISLNVDHLLPGNYLVRLDCERDSKRQWIQKR